jgi:hypothetical protein
MRAGMVLTHFFVLLLATTASLLLRAAAERRFDPAPGTPPPVAAVAPRCYTLALEGPDSASARRWVPVRSPVCLAAAPALGPGAKGWGAALTAAPDTARDRFVAPHARPARWRPAGVDSLDVVFADWPVSVRLRIPTAGAVAHGRLVATGDSFFVIGFHGGLYAINWPPVYRVRAERVGTRAPAT